MDAEIKSLKAKINNITKESELFKAKKQDEFQQLTQKLNKTTTDLSQNKSNIENWKSRWRKEFIYSREYINIATTSITKGGKWTETFSDKKNLVNLILFRYASASQKVVELESQYNKAAGELESLKPKLYEAEKSRTTMAAEVETLTKTRDNLLTQSERLVIQTTKLEQIS